VLMYARNVTQPSSSSCKYKYCNHLGMLSHDGSNELFTGGTQTENTNGARFSFPTQVEE
jgi:hypothetical protein